MAAGINKDCEMWDYTYYYENGRIKSQNTEGGPYTGRQEHTEWYDNGNLKSEISYENGKINGKAIKYNKEGEITEEKTYLNGKLIN